MLGTLAVGLLLMAAVVLALGPDVDGIRQLIRVTAASEPVTLPTSGTKPYRAGPRMGR